MQLVWHRGDLRTHDHAALVAAVAAGSTVGVVILDPNVLGPASPRRRAWFLENVRALRVSYEALGGTLLVRTGEPWLVLPVLCAQLRAQRVRALRSHTPYGRVRDQRTAAALARITWHDGLYLRAPGHVRARSGNPFTVFGAFFRVWRDGPAPEPLEPPSHIPAPAHALAECGEIPTAPSDVPLPPAGEAAALAALREFAERRALAYADTRDRLDGAGGARLSYYLNIGALSAATAADALWHRPGTGPQKWLAELAWRDFLADLLERHPELIGRAFQPRWERFHWRAAEPDFVAWRDGRTGIPAVDAAMRQLRATGWISNRARMLAAQFLSKHLRIDWRRGERVFYEWLLDADRASNTGNWQWAAGLGIDNVPYFRVFNPVAQAEQHDPDGTWLQRWVPECNGDPRPLPGAIVNPAQARRDYLAAVEALP
ncbi:MAG: deoxyribodipyrimidine photo-lyase [Gemmatimonadetes bacterium]|nr:deoxyribodipyrimidine photo-lyase [Gemmatimonadota bacterium]